MEKNKYKLFLLVGVIEVIGHFIIRLLEDDLLSWKILHFVAWSLFSIFCIIKIINSNNKTVYKNGKHTKQTRKS